MNEIKVFTNEDFGEVRINIKTLVFQKGIDWIRKQLEKET